MGEAYKTFNTWITNQITQSRHSTLTPRINVIAYYNQIKKMKNFLLAIYKQQSEIPADLEHDLDMELKRLENLSALDCLGAQRKVYARRMLRWKKWKQLKRQFVSTEFQKKRLLDPEVIISDVIFYCSEKGKSTDIKAFLDTRIQELQSDDPDWYNKIGEELDEDITNAGSDIFDAYVLFLSMRLMVLPSALINKNLLPAAYRLHRPIWIVGLFEWVLSSLYALLRWICRIPGRIINWVVSKPWNGNLYSSKSGKTST